MSARLHGIALDRLSAIDLCVLYEAYEAAERALLGLQNQPRCEGSLSIIEDERGDCYGKMDLIAQALLAQPHVDDNDRFERTRVLARWAFSYRDQVSEAIAIIATAAATPATAGKQIVGATL